MQNPFPNGFFRFDPKDPLAKMGFGFSSIYPKSLNPQYQQWNLSIQRQVPGNGVVEINYSASKGTHLFFGSGDVMGNYNKVDPIYYPLGPSGFSKLVPNPFYGIVTAPTSLYSLPTIAQSSLLRPHPQFGSMGGYLAPPNIGNSNYHSMQLKYERRFSKGVSVVGHYTWSKFISDCDTDGSDTSWLSRETGVQDFKHLNLERSVAVFDTPHRFITSFNVQLPLGRGKAIGNGMNKILDGVIGGWELAGVITLQKGYPLSPALDSTSLPTGTQRPNISGNPCIEGGSIEDKMNKFLDASVFSQPAPYTFGNAPRLLPNCRQPGTKNMDATLMKNFGMGEQRRLQLRLEAYNATNTPRWGSPNTSYGNSSFGQISSASNSRTVQVAAKFYF